MLPLLVGSILGAAAAVADHARTPQTYTLWTNLQITPFEPLFRENDDPTREAEYRHRHAALVRTRPVISKALENKKVVDCELLRTRPDPAGWLEDELRTTLLDGGLLRVSLSGENPDELATVLNAVADAYLGVVVDAEEARVRSGVEQLDRVLATVEDRVRKMKSEERALAEALRIGDSPSGDLRRRALTERYLSVQRDLLAIESQLRDARGQLTIQTERRDAAGDQPIPQALVGAALAADPVVKSAAAEIAVLREHLASKTDPPDSVPPARRTAELKAAEERLATARLQRREPVLKELRERLVRDAEMRMTEIEGRVRLLQHQHLVLKNETDLAMREVEKLGQGSFELDPKRAELAAAQALLAKLRDRREQNALEVMTYRRRVQISSPAEAGAARPVPVPLAGTIKLSVAGFVLGVLGVGLVRTVAPRLRS